MLICASRPIGYWFEGGLASTLEEGSPYDRIALSVLIMLSMIVVFRRKIEWGQVFKSNIGLIVLYAFLGISILWSDYQFVSFKRWIRLLGAIPVAMVVLSEKSPLDAMESIFRRCAYILLPFSLVLIKYYPHFGVGFGRWSGLTMWTGVTTTKNSLGQLCAFSALFMFWAYIRDKKERRMNRSVLTNSADGLVFALAIFMLAGIGGAFSATSSAVLTVGVVSVLTLYSMEHSRQKIANILLAGTVILWLLLIYSETLMPFLSALLKRDDTLTGRTDIWQMALMIAERHPFLGAGYGGYWVTGNEISEAFSGYLTAHNGLLDVYIETGIVGIILLLWFHYGLFKRFCRALMEETGWAIFGVCFLIMSLLYNYTESIFLKSSLYIWNITICLSIIFTSRNMTMKKNT